jgi:hypothetical protein
VTLSCEFNAATQPAAFCNSAAPLLSVSQPGWQIVGSAITDALVTRPMSRSLRRLVQLEGDPAVLELCEARASGSVQSSRFWRWQLG